VSESGFERVDWIESNSFRMREFQCKSSVMQSLEDCSVFFESVPEDVDLS